MKINMKSAKKLHEKVWKVEKQYTKIMQKPGNLTGRGGVHDRLITAPENGHQLCHLSHGRSAVGVLVPAPATHNLLSSPRSSDFIFKCYFFISISPFFYF